MNPRILLTVFVSIGIGFVLAEMKAGPESKLFAEESDQTQIPIDDSKAVAQYANFCRITGTPEELIVDYGFNAQPSGMPKQPIVVGPRVVMNFYTAKRMLNSLQRTIQRHEATFGPLETDVMKRIKQDTKDSKSSEQP